jgi:hypothetical protein
LALILAQNPDWAMLWASFFAQTHLVTLIASIYLALILAKTHFGLNFGQVFFLKAHPVTLIASWRAAIFFVYDYCRTDVATSGEEGLLRRNCKL